jgi:hypothetical protein
MGYDMVISATDMVHLEVQRICQLLDGKVGAVLQNLAYCPWTCPSTKARLCIRLKPGVLALTPVVESLM